MAKIDVAVIGGGQAGLSTAYYLQRRGVDFVVFDHSPAPGGAWQFRWPTLLLSKTHRVHDLPGMPLGSPDASRQASDVVSEYFARYESTFDLPVRRPVDVRAVRYAGLRREERKLAFDPEPIDGVDERRRREDHSADDDFDVETSDGVWQARVIVNATGTWDRPFVPHYPGQETFRGRQLHSSEYRRPDEFADQHVVVVGGGASATQQLAEISEVATTTWVTRREPIYRTEFTEELGRHVEMEVAANTRAGLPTRSVVSYTGLGLTPIVQRAAERGVLERLPMFERITPDGVTWADGTHIHADTILWATGFRPVVSHLAPLKLREPAGGYAVERTQSLREPRLFLVGYGPSASTIGASRAGRVAASKVDRLLRELTPEPAIGRPA